MSPHSATFQDAINCLLCITGWADGCDWIDLERSNLPSVSRTVGHSWLQVKGPVNRRRAVHLVRALDENYSPEIVMTLPRKQRGWGTVTASTVCWARIEGSKQVERARKFRPHPTVVLQEGTSSRRLLLWGLSRPLSWDQTVQANKRIAYRLGSLQKAADPDELRIPLPGTCLRSKKKPIPIVVGRLDLDGVYTPREVVGQLKDPPEVKWWEKAA